MGRRPRTARTRPDSEGKVGETVAINPALAIGGIELLNPMLV
ncbi:hypothetical protein I552_2334 [Mycobacterium xenopi 3993]|nr:hypothetical protein I552_2334 [Mycobacterium xenopi 3993]